RAGGPPRRRRRGEVTAHQLIEGQNFDVFDDRDSGSLYENMEFRHCEFRSGALSIATRPELRSTVRNVKLVDCFVGGAHVHTAVIEDSIVDGLRTAGLFQAWGPVFKHVTVQGKIGRVMISDLASPLPERKD